MSAREAILNAVRGGLGHRTLDPAALRREADALLEDLPAIRPGLLADDLVEAFIARLVTPKVAATSSAACRDPVPAIPSPVCIA